MNVESVNADEMDVHGQVQQVVPRGAEGEFVDGDERLGHLKLVGIELEAGAGDFKSSRVRRR